MELGFNRVVRIKVILEGRLPNWDLMVSEHIRS